MAFPDIFLSLLTVSVCSRLCCNRFFPLSRVYISFILHSYLPSFMRPFESYTLNRLVHCSIKYKWPTKHLITSPPILADVTKAHTLRGCISVLRRRCSSRFRQPRASYNSGPLTLCVKLSALYIYRYIYILVLMKLMVKIMLFHKMNGLEEVCCGCVCLCVMSLRCVVVKKEVTKERRERILWSRLV